MLAIYVSARLLPNLKWDANERASETETVTENPYCFEMQEFNLDLSGQETGDRRLHVLIYNKYDLQLEVEWGTSGICLISTSSDPYHKAYDCLIPVALPSHKAVSHCIVWIASEFIHQKNWVQTNIFFGKTFFFCKMMQDKNTA